MNRQFQDDQRPRNSRSDVQFPSNSRSHDNSGHDRRNSDQPKKEEPNFGLSGKLTEYTNTYKVGFTLITKNSGHLEHKNFDHLNFEQMLENYLL